MLKMTAAKYLIQRPQTWPYKHWAFESVLKPKICRSSMWYWELRDSRVTFHLTQKARL